MGNQPVEWLTASGQLGQGGRGPGVKWLEGLPFPVFASTNAAGEEEISPPFSTKDIADPSHFFFGVRGEGGSQHGCLHINSGRNNKSVSFTFTRTPRWAELQFFFVSGFVGCCVGQENRNGYGSFCRCLEWGTTGLVDELAGWLARWLAARVVGCVGRLVGRSVMGKRERTFCVSLLPTPYPLPSSSSAQSRGW